MRAVVIACLVCTACAGDQGIKGRVLVMSGNFMPRAEGTPPHGSTTAAPAVRVHVYRGRHRPVETLDRSDPAYLTSVVTDGAGAYKVRLAPGTYTVVTEHEGAPYLNCLSSTATGEPDWCAVEVRGGAWTERDLRDDADSKW